MGTTSLIVELVIIGFQVSIWTFLFLLSIWGYDWINLTNLKDWSGIITISLIAVSYTLGIIFDRFITSIFSSWSYSTTKPIAEVMKLTEKDNSAMFAHVPPVKMKAYILATDSSLGEHLEIMSNQNKLVRATSVNLALISIAVVVFVATRIGFSWQSATTILLLLLPMTFISIKSWQRAYRSFYYELGIIYMTLKEREKATDK